jgi:hypothetical protein
LEGLVGDHAGANMSGIEGAVETLNQETVAEKASSRYDCSVTTRV